MKKRSKIIALMLAVVLTMGLAACSSNSSSTNEPVESAKEEAAPAEESTQTSNSIAGSKTEEDTIKIGIVVKQAGAPYFDYAAGGAEKAAADLNAEIVSYTGPTSEDVNQEITFIEDLITQGVDAILVSTADSTAIIPTINKAMDAGIAVFTFDIDAPDSNRLFCITAGNAEESGAAIGESLASAVGGEGQVALLTGGLGSDTLNRRLAAIEEVLAGYPDIEIVATEACDDDFEKCVSQVENLMQTYPDLKAVAGVSTVNPPAAAMAIRSAGKEGQVISLGIALPSQIMEYVDAGIIPEAILWDPGVMGYDAVAAACDYLRNGNLPENAKDYGEYGGQIVVEDGDSVAYIPSIVFTKDNVHDFEF